MRTVCKIGALLCLAAGMTCPAAGEAVSNDRDLELLLDGVSEIGAPGVPGPLCVFGNKAFPVVTGGAAKDVRAPVVAAARAGRGRIVAFGHGGYFGAETLATADTGRLMANAVRWVTGPNMGKDGPRVGVRNQGGLLDFLSKQSFRTEALNDNGWEKRLSSFNVVCVDTHGLNEEEIVALRQFVSKGGGLITAGLGWGWQQLNPKKNLLTDHPGNRLLAPAGIVWADGYFSRTSDLGYEVKGPPTRLTHAAVVLKALVAHADGKVELSNEEMAQAVWIATHAVRSLPPYDKALRPKFHEIARTRSTDAIPTPDKPLKMEQPLARVIVAMQLEAIKDLPPEKVKAHPAGAAFPGAVPADAKRGFEIIQVDTSVPRWHSTGLYTPPGEMIKVGVNEEAAGRGLVVRIGCHADHIWHHDQWRRCPEITRQFPIEEMTTNAANAFGGLVYIEVPENCPLGTIAVKIGNVVQAPHYILGKTDLKEWRTEIRNRPVPWAELETSKVILTVPSEQIRDLDDPNELMDFWDRVMDACADLAARPRERKRPERYVTDTQISVGYMHAGCPIMTHLDAAERMVNLKTMKDGDWGMFHEMGHNHQSGDWTFDGTVEVTVNLFTLYVFEKVCGKMTDQHPSFTAEERAKRTGEYLAGGADFEEWKRKPFLALIMYIQMQEAFGWDAFKNVFTEYRDLPDNERPKNDDEKRDQWLVRFSREVGKDLGPFFVAWGVPTSEEARASIADLPDWMPEGFPPTSEGDSQ